MLATTKAINATTAADTDRAFVPPFPDGNALQATIKEKKVMNRVEPNYSQLLILVCITLNSSLKGNET